MKNRIQLVFGILILIALQQKVIGQQTTFSKIYYGDPFGSYESGTIVSLFDNSYFIAGTTGQNGLLFKIDSIGHILWNKTFEATQNVAGSFQIYNMITLQDSNYLLLGRDYDSITQLYDIMIIKIDISGTIIWSKAVGTSGYTTATSVEQTFDGGFIVAGEIDFQNAPYTKAFASKFNANGIHEWTKEFTIGNNSNVGSCVRQTIDSAYVLTGFFENDSLGVVDFNDFILKLNPTGDIIWSKKYNRSPKVYTKGIALYISDDGILSLTNYGLMKLDTAGNIIWARKIDTNYDESDVYARTPNINKTTDGDYAFVTGNCWGMSQLFVFDSSGYFKMGGEMILYATNMAIANDKSFIIVGIGPMCAEKKLVPNYTHIGVIKIDSLASSQQCFSHRLTFDNLDDTIYGSPITVSTHSDSIIHTFIPTINSINLVTEDGCVGQGGGIKNEKNESDNVQVYPVPTKALINVDAKEIINYFELIDISGKCLLGRKTNCLKFEIDLGELSNGLYFLTLYEKGNALHRKLIKE
ncbi:MAG: T9SS type A sorting domain-containing protein [Bacteroidota bacterium]